MQTTSALRMAAVIAAGLSAFAVAKAQTTPPQTAPAAQTGERQPGQYPLGPDSLQQPGVPKGRLEGPFQFRSQIIANTVRLYWIYVPAQYVAGQPANVLVFQDGNRSTNPTGS